MKKRRILLAISLFTGLGILQNSCTTEQAPLPLVSKTLCDSLNPKWSADIEAIILTQCLNPGCHKPGSPNYVGPDLSGYAQVEALAKQGRIKARVLDGNVNGWMPPPPAELSTQEKQKIECWLNAGAPNN